MPTVQFPLFTRSYRNVDSTVLTDDAAFQYNGFIDEQGGVNVRPGEVLAFQTSKRNDGLFSWPDKNLILCVEDGSAVLRSVSGDTLVTAYTGSAYLSFPAGNIVTFADNGDYVFMAAGGKINYIDATGTVSEMSDADAPTAATHVRFLDGYILAIDGADGKFKWADANTPTSWSALSFATAEGAPDKNQALEIVQRQIYILGTTSTEIWENDGVSPFSRIPGGLIEMGCIAKYSPIRWGNSLVWLNHTRQFVQFTGTSVKFISGRYDKEIARFSQVDDCIGSLVYYQGREYLVFQFPAEGRTLAYDPSIDDWCEWAVWDLSSMSWIPYDIRSATRDIVSGRTFIGKGSGLCISCLNADSRVDLSGEGLTSNRIRFLRRTGHINSGTLKKKRLQELRFIAKRGYGATDDTEPKLVLRYRDNNNSTWSSEREIGLGRLGEYDSLIRLKSLGMYESRQFEVSFYDSAPLVLSHAEGDISIS